MNPLITVENLVKEFPKVRAVDGISFKIHRGICFGMLGPNGAGKTTTIEILEGISNPTSGTIYYKGEALGRKYKQEIGIQFQTTSLQDKLTCREVIAMFSNMYIRSVSTDDLIKECDLSSFADRDTKKLSGGERQRMLLAVALVNDPVVIFMDEPTTGLDPQARQNFWRIVRKIKSQGKTIILTTHYMEEASALCDEIVFMNHGKIIAQGNPHVLLDTYFKGVTLRFPYDDLLLDKLPSRFKPHKNDDSIEMHITNINNCLASLISLDVNLDKLSLHKPTLDDLFLHVTEKKETN